MRISYIAKQATGRYQWNGKANTKRDIRCIRAKGSPPRTEMRAPFGKGIASFPPSEAIQKNPFASSGGRFRKKLEKTMVRCVCDGNSRIAKTYLVYG